MWTRLRVAYWLVALAIAITAIVFWMTASSSPPDVLVLVIDAARADRLGCYGGPRPTSPNLDKLAAEGVLFENACVSAPRTWQSFSSILTGLYPLHHGVRYLWDNPLRPEIPTLASVLREGGYDTVAFDAISFLRGMTGGRGFEFVVDAHEAGKKVEDKVLLEMITKWLRLESSRPRLAFVRLHGPHWPYAAEERFLIALGEEKYRHLSHEFLESTGSGLVLQEDGKGFALADTQAYNELFYRIDRAKEEREHRILHYDAALRTTDELVGRLLGALRESGKLDSILLVATSDHGEGFGEHGYLQHGPRVDQGVMAVPLIIRFPETHLHGRRGQRVSQLVRSVDIMPTVLATLGIPVPDGLDGESLLGVIDSGQELRSTCYGESGRAYPGVDPNTSLPGVAGKERMLRDLRFKLVYRHNSREPTYRLYDLQADPDETADVSERYPEETARLRLQFEALLATDVNIDKVEGPITDDQREQLRALGYLR